jgi:hypothetical protein
MAYNRQNLLIRIIEIQEIYLEHQKKGISCRWIYVNIIYPKYRISVASLYRYLATNAKKELKELVSRQIETISKKDTTAPPCEVEKMGMKEKQSTN